MFSNIIFKRIKSIFFHRNLLPIPFKNICDLPASNNLFTVRYLSHLQGPPLKELTASDLQRKLARAHHQLDLSYYKINIEVLQNLLTDLDKEENFHLVSICWPNIYDKSLTTIIQKITKRIQSHAEGFVMRPSDYLYALLSVLSYRNDGGENFLPKGWSLLKIDNEPAIRFSNDGYVGVAYVNNKHKQIVVAHRGTESHVLKNLLEFIKDWRTNAESVSLHQIGRQQQAASKFSAQIMQIYSDSYHISFTGHSLGGWLAQIVVYELMRERNKKYNVHAVVFDSPGVKEMLEKLQPNDVASRINIHMLDITHYRSWPNLLNATNQHIGTAYQLYPAMGNISFFNYSSQSHDKEKLLAEFDCDTEKPRLYHKIESWPCINWSELTKGLNSINFLLAKLIIFYLYDMVEYNTFHKFMAYKENLGLYLKSYDFSDSYLLKNKAKYILSEVVENELHVRHFTAQQQFFLNHYLFHGKIKKIITLLEHSPLLDLSLNAREALKNFILKYDFKINIYFEQYYVEVSFFNSMHEFRTQLAVLLYQYPELLKFTLPSEEFHYKDASILVELLEMMTDQIHYIMSFLNQTIDNKLYKYMANNDENDNQVRQILLVVERIKKVKILKEKLKFIPSASEGKQLLNNKLDELSNVLEVISLYEYARLYLIERKYLEAAHMLEQAFKILEKSSILDFYKKKIYMHLHNIESKVAHNYKTQGIVFAKKACESALKYAPNHPLLLTNYAALLNNIGREKLPAETTKEAYKFHQQAMLVHNQAVNAASHSEKMICLCNRAYGYIQYALDEETATLTKKYSFLSFWSPKFDHKNYYLKRAVTDLTDIIKNYSIITLNVYLFRAVANIELGNYELAKIDLEIVLKETPDHPLALRRKGQVSMMYDHNLPEAEDLFKRARATLLLRSEYDESVKFWLSELEKDFCILEEEKIKQRKCKIN